MISSNTTLKAILFPLLIILFLIGFTSTVTGQSSDDNEIDSDYTVDVEAGLLWFSRNDVRIPNSGGTEFDMLGLISSNPAPYLRLSLSATLEERHTFRLVFAPLQKIGTGVFDSPVVFEETTFDPNIPTEGLYRFNTYRLTYRYLFYNRNNWAFGAGIAGLVRDAKVEISQPGFTDSNTDLGIVPLLHIYAKRHLGERASITLDAEGLASPQGQGRAFDAAIRASFKVVQNWHLTAGYRVLEGGADVDEVYNFSWINFASAGIRLDI